MLHSYTHFVGSQYDSSRSIDLICTWKLRPMQRCGVPVLCKCVEAALPTHGGQSSRANTAPSKRFRTLLDCTLCLVYNMSIRISTKGRLRNPAIDHATSRCWLRFRNRSPWARITFHIGLQLCNRSAAADSCTVCLNLEGYAHVSRQTVRPRLLCYLR